MDLGLERAGMKCVWQVESNKFCNKVLQKHWPKVKRWSDVKTFVKKNIGDWEHPDLIAGGFPCQDLSIAGKGKGIEGERSGLWTEFSRVIRIFRPRFVLVENVSMLLQRGGGKVFGDLAKNGYDAEWDCIPACYVGSPQRRDRIFIVAYLGGKRRERVFQGKIPRFPEFSWSKGIRSVKGYKELSSIPQPILCRNYHGIPDALERITGLGNAVVPAIAEWIGQRIIKLHQESHP